jgi:hypothetical protein
MRKFGLIILLIKRLLLSSEKVMLEVFKQA